MTTPSTDVVGAGWAFPVGVDARGRIALSRRERDIEEAILLILLTPKGQRVMRPEFGCQIHDLMFAPNNPLTAARAEIYCEEAIYKYEPRVEKVVCRAGPNPDEPNRLDVRIEYVIAGKNDKRNLVFPFYLKNADDEANGSGA